jgi:hypothetical protein
MDLNIRLYVVIQIAYRDVFFWIWICFFHPIVMQLLEGGAANLVCVCFGEEIVAETREGEGSDGVGCVLLPFLLSVLALQFSLWTSFWYVSFLFPLFRGFSSL